MKSVQELMSLWSVSRRCSLNRGSLPFLPKMCSFRKHWTVHRFQNTGQTEFRGKFGFQLCFFFFGSTFQASSVQLQPRPHPRGTRTTFAAAQRCRPLAILKDDRGWVQVGVDFEHPKYPKVYTMHINVQEKIDPVLHSRVEILSHAQNPKSWLNQEHNRCMAG